MIVAGGSAGGRLQGRPDLADPLLGGFVQTDLWTLGIKRAGIHFQQVLHEVDKFSTSAATTD